MEAVTEDPPQRSICHRKQVHGRKQDKACGCWPNVNASDRKSTADLISRCHTSIHFRKANASSSLYAPTNSTSFPEFEHRLQTSTSAPPKLKLEATTTQVHDPSVPASHQERLRCLRCHVMMHARHQMLQHSILFADFAAQLLKLENV
jgi:hypothetical protein